MAHLLDSNLLLRWANRGDGERPLALSAMRKLGRQGEALHTTPQNYTEFWSSATRPAGGNGLGLTPAQTERLVRRLRTLFPVLPDTGAIFDEWLRIVVAAAVSGRQVYDARLVAVMLAHGITHILTFDVNDFKRYQAFGITIVHPADVA
jgi:predicted nucleic acid-binding protein